MALPFLGIDFYDHSELLGMVNDIVYLTGKYYNIF